MDKKWNIDPKSIKDPVVQKDMDDRWRRALATMQRRTSAYNIFSLIAHNQSIYRRDNNELYSEGSTQGIKRKIRSQTIQRVPDGEITTQFDKNSIEQIETEFIFKNKILTSEVQGASMLKNLLKAFGAAYDYGFACVRTGFKKDTDGDIRTSFSMIQWNDIYPAPDCKAIEEAEWYIVREYMSRSELEALIDAEGNCSDATYNADVIKYLVENEIKSGVDPNSMALADKQKAITPFESVELRTLYKRGDSEFITYVPSCGAVLRTVKNYDPRKDLPLHFLILDPDPEFPLGASSVMWTMSQQQFADAFQTLSYETLLLACNPPLMGFGNLTPSSIKMKPRAFWRMGNNDKNRIEKFPVETTTITQYGSILENVQARMMAALNIADGTIASDANTMGYSKTNNGVELQKQDKTISINQFQKQVEGFFSEWANHALRSYINAMSGVHELTVDEETRRKIWDVEMTMSDPMTGDVPESIINGDKVSIDFDALSTDLLAFSVRTGSLIESEKEIELQHIQEALVSVSQMMNAISDQNKDAFENVLMQLIVRFLELSDIDVSQQTADKINEKLLMGAMQATMEQVMGQQGQIDQIMGALGQQGMLPQGQPMPQQMPMDQQLPPEAMGQMPPAQMPMPQQEPMLPEPQMQMPTQEPMLTPEEEQMIS